MRIEGKLDGDGAAETGEGESQVSAQDSPGMWFADQFPGSMALLHQESPSYMSIYAQNKKAAAIVLSAVNFSSEKYITLAGIQLPLLIPLRLKANLKAKLKFGLFVYDGSATEEDNLDPVMDSLQERDAELVTKHWDHSDEISYIKARIDKAPTAVVRGEDDAPLAWALTHSEGAVGVLYTLENSRRQGLGERVARSITNRLLMDGRVPFCYIADNNEASTRLFEKLGYKKQAQPVFWAMCEGPTAADSSDSEEA